MNINTPFLEGLELEETFDTRNDSPNAQLINYNSLAAMENTLDVSQDSTISNNSVNIGNNRVEIILLIEFISGYQ